MSKLSAVSIVVLFSLSLFASMIGNDIQLNDDVLTESENVLKPKSGLTRPLGVKEVLLTMLN